MISVERRNDFAGSDQRSTSSNMLSLFLSSVAARLEHVSELDTVLKIQLQCVWINSSIGQKQMVRNKNILSVLIYFELGDILSWMWFLCI